MKFTAYPRVNEDILANNGKDVEDMSFYGVCVNACNTGMATVVCDNNLKLLNAASGAIQEDIFNECFRNTGSSSRSWPYGPDQAPVSCSSGMHAIRENCWAVPYNTSSVLFRCVPKYSVDAAVNTVCSFPTQDSNGDPLSANSADCLLVTEQSNGETVRPAKTNALFDKLNSASQAWGRYMGDLARSWWVIIVAGIVLPIVLAMVYLVFIKYCTGVMVWFTIIGALVVSVLITFFLYYKAGAVSSDKIDSLQDSLNSANSGNGNSEVTSDSELQGSEDSNSGFRYGAYAMTVVSVAVLVMIIALRKSIRIAIDVLKLGAKAVQSLGLELLTFPLVSALMLFAITMWFLFVSAYLMSAAALNKNSSTLGDAELAAANATAAYSVAEFADNDTLRYMFIYHFFGFLWTANWFAGISFVTIASSVGGWYFARPVPSGSKAPVYNQPEKLPVYKALLHTLKFYMGSVALGSFLIAFVQFTRAAVAYVERKSQELAVNSCAMKMVFKCMHCLLWCLECVVRIITRNAYIFIAVKGNGFCSSGAAAVSAILANFRTLALVNSLGQVVMWLGKLTIATVSAFIGLQIIESVSSFQSGEDEVFSPWLPAMVCFAVAFLIANTLLQLWDASVDTLLMCYIMDAQEAHGAPQHAGDNDFVKDLHVKHGEGSSQTKPASASNVKNPL